MTPYDLIIPIIIYVAVLLIFGFTVFKWLVVLGIIIGAFVILWLFLEKDSVWNKRFEKIWAEIKRSSKKIWDIIWN